MKTGVLLTIRLGYSLIIDKRVSSLSVDLDRLGLLLLLQLLGGVLGGGDAEDTVLAELGHDLLVLDVLREGVRPVDRPGDDEVAVLLLLVLALDHELGLVGAELDGQVLRLEVLGHDIHGKVVLGVLDLINARVGAENLVQQGDGGEGKLDMVRILMATWTELLLRTWFERPLGT